MSPKHWCVLAGLVAGCGTVTDPEMMGDDQPPPDTTAPKLMSSTPADGSTKAGVIAPLTFTFDEALDPASVAHAVTVSYANGRFVTPVFGGTTYDDASHTISFTPKVALPYGMNVTVQVSDAIKDVSGNAFAGDDLSFTVAVNPETKYVGYDYSTGAVQSWQAMLLDANGFPTKSLYFNTPGADGVWFNADDNTAGRSDQIYNAKGQVLEYRGFDAGPDGRYNTNDDTITYLQKNEYDASGRLVKFTETDSPGIDNMWGTADDPVSYYGVSVASAGQVMLTSYSDPGPDGVLMTADDRTSYYQVIKLDANGLQTSSISYTTGADQLPNTTDDTVNNYSTTTWSADGVMTSSAYYNNPGPDGMWLTADDPMSSLTKWDLDANGYQKAQRYYSAPGPDGTWNTADDIAGSYQSYMTDTHGLITDSLYYSSAGTDGIWGTADDVPGSYQTYTFDAQGMRTKYTSFSGAGPDNVWRTADDRLASEGDYDPTH